MKKILFLLLMLLLLLSQSGCTAQQQPETESDKETVTEQPAVQPEQTEEPEVDQEKLLDQLRYSIELLDLCFDETCGAQMNTETAYSRVYSSMDAMLEGEEMLDIIPQNELEEETDAAALVLYEITNYKTNDEVRKDLLNYFTESVVNDVFPAEFIEFKGKLYMGYGGRGYGMHDYDLDSAEIIELTENTCRIDVDYLMHGQPEGTASIYFENVDGNWLISAFQE